MKKIMMIALTFCLFGVVFFTSCKKYQTLDIITNTQWKNISGLPSVIKGIGGACPYMLTDTIFLTGVQNTISAGKKAYIYKPSTNNYSEITSSNFSRKNHASMYVRQNNQNYIYLFGGAQYSTTPGHPLTTPVQEIERYNISANTWETLPTSIPNLTEFAYCHYVGNNIAIIGGKDSCIDYVTYDPTTNNLSSATTLVSNVVRQGRTYVHSYSNNKYIFGYTKEVGGIFVPIILKTNSNLGNPEIIEMPVSLDFSQGFFESCYYIPTTLAGKQSILFHYPIETSADLVFDFQTSTFRMATLNESSNSCTAEFKNATPCAITLPNQDKDYVIFQNISNVWTFKGYN